MAGIGRLLSSALRCIRIRASALRSHRRVQLTHRFLVLAYFGGLLLYWLLLEELADWSFFATMALATVMTFATLGVIAWLEIRRIRRR